MSTQTTNNAGDLDLSEVVASSGFPVLAAGAYEAMASAELTEVNGTPTIRTTYTITAVLESDEEVAVGFEHGEITMLNENAKYSIGKIDKLLGIVGKTRAELKTVSAICEAIQNVSCVVAVKVKADKKDKDVKRAEVIESSIQAN
jgi:hypothetical protein